MSLTTALNNREALMPVVYLPHGGGPMPLLGEPGHNELTAFLKGIPTQLPRPKAILMVSAHWESDIARVSSASWPEMIYDYGGFPPESYEYQYSAPGAPELASVVIDLLESSNIECQLDGQRGFDHGTFVPLMLMYPEASIPVVQVSLLRSLAPEKHIALGEALASLREQGVLIVGSGMSFHNFNGTFEHSVAFDDWLTDILVSTPLASAKSSLKNWQEAPAARDCHSREEHLLPLHVCFGAASASSSSAQKIFSGLLFNRRVAGFLWS